MNRCVTLIGLAAGGATVALALSLGTAGADVSLPDGPTTTPGNYGLDHPNVFGLTPLEPPTWGGAVAPWYQHIMSGYQTFNFDSNDIAPFVQDFLTKYVTVDGNPINFDDASYIFGGLNLPVINTLEAYTSEQQIILPRELFDDSNTNVEWGVMDVHNWGNFFGPWGYVYIDLVGAGDSGPTNDAIGTWFTTPFGAFDVSWLENGSFFGSAYLESQLFDLDNFNPTANMADLETVPGSLLASIADN